MTEETIPFIFPSGQDRLVGIIHKAHTASEEAVLIIVGGPQYRTGAHRQYLHLARTLASKGVHAMRFDYAGIGDSEGQYRGFESVDGDIRSAIDAFFEIVPAIKRLSIWGLCEGASACLFYGPTDPRVTGLILANPWVHSEEGEAKAYLKHYYGQRFFNKDLWQKVFSGQFEFRNSLRDIFQKVKAALKSSPKSAAGAARYQDRMAEGLRQFKGPVFLILSGNDLVAREFEDYIASDGIWQTAMAAADISRFEVPDSDHTFSCEQWRRLVALGTADWVLALKARQKPEQS